MKKILLILLCSLCLYGITGCRNEKKGYSIGDTMKNDNWEVTLKSAEFVDFMNIETAQLQLGSVYGYKDFGSTTIKPNDDEYLLKGKNGNVLLAYTLEYKYVGKKEYNCYFFQVGETTIKYNDEYTFNENFLNFIKDDNEEKWMMLSEDDDVFSNISALKHMVHKTCKYKQLEDKTYYVKGVIALPEKVKNDDKGTLTIQFNELTNNEKFIIR